ncbi:hypothetical protein MBLNU230_g4687t1 [Neophaeotheca triangularis]
MASSNEVSGATESGSPLVASGSPASNSTPNPRPFHAPMGFQAINHINQQAASQHGNLSETQVRSTASTPQPPPKGAAVAGAPAFSNPSDDPGTSKPSPRMDGPDGTATYGTRSRQRNNARPNYAEDQEMDYDFVSSAATTKPKKDPAHPTPPAPSGEARQPQDFARFVPVNAGNSNSPQPAQPKETTSASPSTTTNPKKRKAAGAPTNLNTVTATSNSSAPSAARKPAASASASTSARETNVMTFTKRQYLPNKNGELISDDGTKLCVNDHVYLISEPPGDPYYLARIMEFLHEDNNPMKPVDSIRVNWFYRPRDVMRSTADSRLLYATMHSDTSPISSLRGKCTIKHKSEISDLDAYRKERDSFYFIQVFDRFIRRWYECIPTSQIINVPEKVKKALDERWKFVAVEIGRVKELTSAVKTCKRCTRYCASSDSVDCAICKNSYHMNCVQPPLPKKPSRGFAWACGPCSRVQEKGEAYNSPSGSGQVTEAEDDGLLDESEPAEASNDITRAPSPTGTELPEDDHPATQAEIALAKMWPMRYLGIHCRVEDALQYDDRAIYPRASSRLGPRHQANISMWHGRPVELVKPADVKKRFIKNSSHKKDAKLSKETLAAIEADRVEKAKRPKWVQDEPPGYVARGEDYPNDDPRCTATRLFVMPTDEEKVPRGDDGQPVPGASEEMVDAYMKRAKNISHKVGVPFFGTNWLDKAVEMFAAHKYNANAALKALIKMDRKHDLHEPVLTKSELTQFEEGVALYGSEHRNIRLHMKNQLPHRDVVRFYYLWKKTPKGKEIWGSYGGRKGKKRRADSDAAAKLAEEVADHGDDSAFDSSKATRNKRGFCCKFCNTKKARQWRKAPGVTAGQTVPADGKKDNKDSKEKGNRLLLALCARCARLWRKYAIEWTELDDVTRRMALAGGRGLKKKMDEELIREIQLDNVPAPLSPDPSSVLPSTEDPQQPPSKKSKTKGAAPPAPPPAPKVVKPPTPPPKIPTPPPPPIIPNKPTWRVLPCAVCLAPDNTIECDHCRLTVHRNCYGLGATEGVKANGEVKWVCDQCQNDRNPTVSTDYKCCLCLTEETVIELVEPPKVSHKKKTEREREKERMEKELTDGMRAEYRSKQAAQNRPLLPREPLKVTTSNNWVHVYCAAWMPEIRFSNAKAFQVAEGFQAIPQAKYDAVCKLCKNRDHQNKIQDSAGACVQCFQCAANFHISCAHEAGYQFGFDLTPVKGSRKDQVTSVTMGKETGSAVAAIWCKEHVVKPPFHPMNEVCEDSGKSALQVYCEAYKQADLTLTGTARKANLAQQTKDKGQQNSANSQTASRRESGVHSIASAVRRGARNSIAHETKAETSDVDMGSPQDSEEDKRHCVRCETDDTPKWHLVSEVPKPAPKMPTPQASPEQRMSMTIGEVTDNNVTSSTEDARALGDSMGRPDPTPPQHIRFMAPGASGRAWDGMASNATRPGTDTDPSRTDQPHEHHERIEQPERQPARTATGGYEHPQMPPPNSASQTNAQQDQTPAQEPSGHTDEGFHAHGLPQYKNPASLPTLPVQEAEKENYKGPKQYYCHKCFLRKKLNPEPTPPPEPQPTESAVAEPPRDFASQLDFISSGPPQPPVQPSFDQALRMPWETEAPRPNHPPGPNPLVHHPSAYGQHPPPQMQHFEPQHPNGFHGPPSHNVGPPPLHHRNGSFGFHGQPPPGMQGYPLPQHQAPRPPSLAGFSNPGMPNGINSPHPMHHPAMPSPGYGPPPPHQAFQQPHQQGPRRTESPFSAQLPPLGGPLHGTPATPFNQPAPNFGNGPQPQHNGQQPQGHPMNNPPPQNHGQQGNGTPMHGMGNSMPPQHPHQQRPVNGSSHPPMHNMSNGQPPHNSGQNLHNQQFQGGYQQHNNGQSQMQGQQPNNGQPIANSPHSQVARPDSRTQRPETPSQMDAATLAAITGASASPNLRNLLH